MDHLLVLTVLHYTINIVICSQYSECGYQSQLYDCPGTANDRIDPIHSHLSLLNINGRSFDKVRMDLVNICGLQNDTFGTSHCFADWTHVDCCPVITQHASNTNEKSKIEGMHQINQLGPHIMQYSLPINDDKNGSWCTCHHGAPKDVCHLQFGSMIAFKLIWCPEYAQLPANNFIALLVDNNGNLLNFGKPYNQPSINTKVMNWKVIMRSKDTSFKNDMIKLCDNAWKMNKREL